MKPKRTIIFYINASLHVSQYTTTTSRRVTTYIFQLPDIWKKGVVQPAKGTIIFYINASTVATNVLHTKHMVEN